MNKLHNLVLISALIISGVCIQCKKQHHESEMLSTITLHDKSLSTIQAYIQGKWKLQYSFGGISQRKVNGRNNSYLVLDPNRIIMGNDSAGVIVDSYITWKKDKDIFNNLTYLLTYSYSGYAFPIAKIVDHLQNDTLVLIDNINDGFASYYTKFN